MTVEMDKILNELEEAALEEGTETGECWRSLCRMWRTAHYGCGDEFISALEKEIRAQYDWFKQNFTWVENSEYCDKCGRGRYSYRELVLNNDL